MKSKFIKFIPVILCLVLFVACKGNKKKTADNDNPVFKSDSRLAEATDQINNDPKNAKLYFHRGLMLEKMHQDTLALNDFKKAATFDSTNAEYVSAIGDLLFEHKDVTGSLVWIKKAIKLNPTDRKAHLKIAKLFMYINDYKEAFNEINIVLRGDVYDPEAYYLKGMVYKQLKDTVKAISSFQTSLQVAPDFRDAVMQLGLLYSAKKDPLALKYLDNAYRMDSTDVLPIFAKGVYYQNTNDYATAKDYYKKCIIHDNQFVDAYFNMGYILLQQDSVDKAYRQYDLVTKIDPTNPAGYYNRGLCSEIMNKKKEAVDDYRQALTLDSTYPSPHDALKRLGVK